MRCRLVSLLILQFWTQTALACSGPGAHRAIAASIAYSKWSALGVALLLVPTLIRYISARRYILASLHVLLLALHPAWHISAMHGDCGQLLQHASTLFLLLAFAAWIISPTLATALNRRRRGFPLD